MTRADTSLPPLRTLEAALHKTTEFLVREIACQTTQVPQWSEFEWRVAEATAAIQGISALLSNGLRWRGPDRWEAFLDDQMRQTFLRQQRIAQMLDRIDVQARQAGIAVVALKGSALYRLGVYPRGDRPMGDIDLLVKGSDVEATIQLVTALDYKQCLTTARHHAFEPRETKIAAEFGEHADNPLKIELHGRIAELLPILETDITALEFPQQPHAGLNPYPSIASLMRHLLLHAAGNIRARALRFIQLHDIALLAARMNHDDWYELLHKGVGARGLWWALAPLSLTASYYPTAIPYAVIDAAAPGAPWLLRRSARRHTLVDVSWSNIRIQAFPGIEWSKSIGETLEFMASRVFPNRKALSDLHQMAATPLYGGSTSWYGLSHVHRILRWVFSNPPRVQTINPIRMALRIQPPSSV